VDPGEDGIPALSLRRTGRIAGMGGLSIALRFVLLLAVLAGLLFGSAGSLDVPAFQGYLLFFAASCFIQYNSAGQDLMKERIKPAPGGTDRITQVVAMLLLVAHLVIAGLDVGRFHWSDSVPGWVQCAALFGLAGGMGIWSLATRENRFFSTVIRIQRERGHHVVSTGPYRFVRHPGYAAAIWTFPLSGLALGSWWSLAPSLVTSLLFIRRTLLEDRILIAELPGYREYAGDVRYRLIPQVW
jgi:protein-S-isoprenylcysteine O-methyltransferase Ste14